VRSANSQRGFAILFVSNIRHVDCPPIGVEAIGLTRSLPVWTGLPLTLVMTSPDCRPAFSAGLPGSTRCNTIPYCAPSSFNTIGLLPWASVKLTPMDPRRDLAVGDELVVDADRGGWRAAQNPHPHFHGFRNDSRIDADHLSGHVHQRAARIARIDGGVSLKESLELLSDIAAILALIIPAVTLPAGIQMDSQSQEPNRRPEPLRIAELGGGQIMSDIDLDDGKIRLFVRADHLRGIERRVRRQSSL